MNYEYTSKDVIIKNVQHFDIDETLDSGQCFRYINIGEKEYLIIAHGKMLRIKQEGNNIIFFDTSEEDVKTIWNKYFSFDTDYAHIKTTLSDKDETMKKAIQFAPGVRILKQDLWEIIITFILSQNNRIPLIKRAVECISNEYGEYIGEHEGIKYYTFPKPEMLRNVKAEKFRELKTGFRDKYIVDAVSKILNKEVDLENIKELDTQSAKKELLKIKGIGNKVADCILLFGLHRYEVFPTDTWIKKIMMEYYLDTDVKIEEIPEYALKYFGEYASYAQQYLFHYARKNE